MLTSRIGRLSKILGYTGKSLKLQERYYNSRRQPPGVKDNLDLIVMENRKEIRQFLKTASPYNTFSPSHISQCQTRNAGRIQRRGWYPKAIAAVTHRSWATLDHERRSAACLYEQYRLRLFVLSFVAAYLKGRGGEVHFVTLCSPKWRAAKDRLGGVDVQPIHRKIQGRCQPLTKVGLRAGPVRYDRDVGRRRTGQEFRLGAACPFLGGGPNPSATEGRVRGTKAQGG